MSQGRRRIGPVRPDHIDHIDRAIWPDLAGALGPGAVIPAHGERVLLPLPY